MIKKSFTLLLATLVTVTLFAADIASRITVSFSGNSNYELRIDGRLYSARGNRLYLNDMRAGRHSIEVYALNNRNRRSSKPVYAANFMVRPRYDMHIVVDRNGRVHFDEQRSGNRYGRNGRNDDEWNRNDRNDHDWNRNDDYSWDNNNRGMSGIAFNQLVQNVRSQRTASRRYAAAQDAASRNYLSTYQVRDLLQLMPSESYRLELAKTAYRNTVDKQSYSQLYSLFSRSGQMELDNYIRNSRY